MDHYRVLPSRAERRRLLASGGRRRTAPATALLSPRWYQEWRWGYRGESAERWTASSLTEMRAVVWSMEYLCAKCSVVVLESFWYEHEGSISRDVCGVRRIESSFAN
jgi:hypothetical protein